MPLLLLAGLAAGAAVPCVMLQPWTAAVSAMAAVRFGRWSHEVFQPVEADLAEYWAQAAVNSYVVKCMGADKSQIDSMQGDGYRMMQQSDAVAEAHILWPVLPIQE